MCEVCTRVNEIAAELDKGAIPADKLTAEALLALAIYLIRSELEEGFQGGIKRAQDAHLN